MEVCDWELVVVPEVDQSLRRVAFNNPVGGVRACTVPRCTVVTRVCA